jgi:hypothetical protein
MTTYNIVDISCKFNKTIKQLILIMEGSISNNIIFDTVKRKIKISIDTNPLYLLQDGGVYLFKYRDLIHSDKFDDLFLNTEELIKDDDKDSIDELSKGLSKESTEGIDALIKILRELWKSYGNQEKTIIKKKIKILLSEYCKYLSISNN